MSTRHLIIKGRVQGVYYRASARQVANELNVKGWIRNTPDGTVEIMASGSLEDLQSFMTWCSKGPEGAEVSDIIISEVEEEIFNDFDIIRGGF